MEKMSGAFRRVRRMVGNPDNSAQVLELLATIRTEATASSKLIPMRAEEVPEAQRAKFVEDFQKRMAEFIAAVEKTEAAVKARDFAAATAMVNDLAAMQEAGHKDFKKDDKKG
jgi:cytochrome c556